MILGEIEPTKGSVKTGVTVKPAYLSQHLEELNPKWRVLEAVEHVASDCSSLRRPTVRRDAPTADAWRPGNLTTQLS